MIYLSLGSNIFPKENIKNSLAMLSKHVVINNISPVFITPPLGGMSQPDYFNCVIEISIKVPMSPVSFKCEVIRKIEESLGRKRGVDKYAPREIDIDILLFDDVIYESAEWRVPSPEVFERDFVFAGLLFLNPQLIVFPSKEPLVNFAENYKLHLLRIDCTYTQLIWKEFLDEHRESCSTN
ncbi:MAG: 2-amino-4-hydroxy-6-hydroxymethyldihydropteridine diphosphokinase [Candidatus Hydrogenedentes bacterium]|nr:2-amino-4-hydroxy-6-hydroxymethyldihydropteridine diphosphokinase [Candidatus Hydrogenedentota bacterium]